MKEMENIQIVLASDENYVQHAGVTMTSLLANRTSFYPLTINFIDGGVSPKNLASLEEIATKYEANFVIHNVNVQEYENFYVSRHISKAAYYRLAISDILPNGVEKAIYLDTDVIVRRDIKELWEIDLSNFAIGAVIDIWLKDNYDLLERLKIPVTEAYFNSGVLLINTVKWREEQIGEKVMRFLNTNDKLPFHDQDALNAILWGRWLGLNPQWNVYKTIFHQYYKLNMKKALGSELLNAARDPYIVHFTGPVKPWHYACATPYTQEYYKYLAMTPWKNYRPSDINLNSFGKRCEWILKRKIGEWVISVFDQC